MKIAHTNIELFNNNPALIRQMSRLSQENEALKQENKKLEKIIYELKGWISQDIPE